MSIKTGQSKPPHQPPPRGKWYCSKSAGVVLLLAGGCVAAVLFVLPQYGVTLLNFGNDDRKKLPPDPPGATKWDAAAVKHMRADLKRWAKTPPGEKDDTPVVAAAYLAALSFTPPDAATESPHPDAVFARRFKPSAARADGPLTPAAFDARLRELVKRLGGEPADEKGTQSDLVAELGKRVDYAKWFDGWAKDGLKAKKAKGELVFPLDHSADAESAAFAARFVPPADPPKEVQEAVRTLVEQLRGWGVAGVSEADARTRPGFVARVYLHFVSGQHFTDKDLDGNDWHAAFLKRLPKPPAGEGQNLATEDGLNKALADLLKAVGGSPGARLPSRVANLRDALDYGAWLESARQDSDNPRYKGYVLDDSLLTPEVVRFAERFRAKPKN